MDPRISATLERLHRESASRRSGWAVAARRHIAEAGLDDVVTLLDGDALQTWADHAGPVDLLFFDGWSDLYDPLLALLEPKLADGAVLVVDNANRRAVRGQPSVARRLDAR